MHHRHRFYTAGITLLLLGGAAPPAAAQLQFGYDWKHQINGATVEELAVTIEPLSDTLSTARYDDNLRSGAGQGNGRAGVSGYIHKPTRKFGVGAVAQSWVNPWNPDTDVPEIVNTDVQASIVFSDTLLAYSPSVLPGDPLFFRIQPALLSGSLTVPPVDALAVGNARLLVTLTVQQVSVVDTEPQVYTLERFVPVNGDNQINGYEFLGNVPLVLVTNLKFMRFTLEMSVSAGVTASPFAPEAPEVAESEADFMSTLVWNGIAGISNASGNLLSDVQISSEQGFDWQTLSAVPEPGTWALWLCGLAVLVGSSRRARPSA